MCCSVKIWDIVFQSTLPREERRLIRGFVFKTDMISIHAPTRGATSNGLMMFDDTLISIHAPTRGATLVWSVAMIMTIFQSTLPREERRINLFCGHVALDFNPRSHERSDSVPRLLLQTTSRFQSTLPREERPCNCRYSSSLTRFQSTLPREERLLVLGKTL